MQDRKLVIIVEDSGIIHVEDIDHLENIGEPLPAEENEKYHYVRNSEEKYDYVISHSLLEEANEKIDETVSRKGLKAIISDFQQMHRILGNDINEMSDDDALTFIKNMNAYELFNMYPDIINDISQEDAKKFSQIHQSLCVLGSLPAMFEVIKEFMHEQGFGFQGELYNIPLGFTFWRLMEADIQSSFDPQDWDNRSCIINGTERVKPVAKSLNTGDIFFGRAGWLGRSVQFFLIKSIDEINDMINIAKLDYVQCGECQNGRIPVRPASYDSGYSDDVISLPMYLYNPDDDIITFRPDKLIICSSEHPGNHHRDMNILRRYNGKNADICCRSQHYFKKGDIFYCGEPGSEEFFKVADVSMHYIKFCLITPEPVDADASYLEKRFSAYDTEHDCFPANSPSMTMRRYFTR